MKQMIMMEVTREGEVAHCADDYDISNKCCFAARACDCLGPDKLLFYEKFFIIGHVYIRTNDTSKSVSHIYIHIYIYINT